MFITIIHYFYLLEWPQQWGAIHRSIGIPCFWRNPSQQRCQFPRLMAPNAPGNLQDSASQQIRQARGKGDRLQAWRRDHRYHRYEVEQNETKLDTEWYRNKMIQNETNHSKSIRARRNMVRYCSCSNSKGTNRNRMSCVLEFSALRSDSSLNDRLASKYWPIWRLAFWC